MILEHGRNMKRWAASVVVLPLLMIAGCQTTRPLQADGLPGEEYLVGGGLMIDWEAPEDGTAYLVEKETGRIIETRSLKQDDSYSFSVSSGTQAKEFEELLGIDFAQARFLLYFEPTGQKP
jgi:hypothetical protein